MRNTRNEQTDWWEAFKTQFLNWNNALYLVLFLIIGAILVTVFNNIPPYMREAAVNGTKSFFGYAWAILKLAVLWVGPFFIAWGAKALIAFLDDVVFPDTEFPAAARYVLYVAIGAILTLSWITFPNKLVTPGSFYATELPGFDFEKGHFGHAIVALLEALIPLALTKKNGSFEDW